MSIILVRKESETPNIQNTDDIIGFRYAGGGQNGVVKNYLNQMGYEISGNVFKVKSGEAIIFGWQVKIDANGATITANNTNNTEYYSVYIEIDLSASDDKKVYLKSTYDTADFPVISEGDDISIIHTGIARMELYRFVLSQGNISDVESRFNLLNGDVLNAKNAEIAENAHKINNLELKQDENGILKIGDIIIPQKKLLWNGDVYYNQLTTNLNAIYSITLSEAVKKGDILEIVWGCGNGSIVNDALVYSPNHKFISKVIVRRFSYDLDLSPVFLTGLDDSVRQNGTLYFRQPFFPSMYLYVSSTAMTETNKLYFFPCKMNGYNEDGDFQPGSAGHIFGESSLFRVSLLAVYKVIE